MNDDPSQKLENLPAPRSADRAHAGASDSATTLAAEPINSLCELLHYGLVRVSGPDAKAFLQGQCTIDLEQVTQSNARLGAFCNPKGRVVTLALFYLQDADYCLRMPKAQIEPILERLGRYILRARVTLTHEVDLLGIGLAGPETRVVFEDCGIDPPSNHYESVHCQLGTIIRVPGDPERFEVYATQAQIHRLRHKHPALSQADCWDLLNIRAGVPEVYPAASELFIPQMLDLEGLGGISFTKGCYTGQEIVARTQYLGNLKRRLVRARIAHGHQPGPGDGLVCQRDSVEQNAAGHILTSAADEGGGFEVLAVVQVSALERDDVNLVTAQGQRLENVNPGMGALHRPV